MEIDIPTAVKMAAYAGSGICIGFGAIGAAVGEGYTAAMATAGTGRHPELSGDIFKTMLVGQAISESSSIFTLVVSLVLIFSAHGAESYLTVAALLAAGMCMGFGALGAGIGAGFPAAAACSGIARQPAMAGPLTTTMIVSSAVCQTPAIFAMVVALMLVFMKTGHAPLHPTWAALLGAGWSVGLAAIGSGYGGGLVAGASCEGVARHPRTVASVTTTMLVGQAVAQTPAIFGLLISFILMFKSFPETTALAPAAAALSAGLCMGFGAIGPGIGNGSAGEGAVRAVARNPDYAPDLMRIMLVGQAVSQSTAIYAMVVSLVLIFVL
jgi:ATP synthase F0 subunit c